jgi:hypothetical protein
MGSWTISRSWTTQPAADADAATYAFELTAEGSDPRHVMVEYATAPSQALRSHAQRVISRYLDDSKPPRRLIVDRDGCVSTRTP